MTVRSSFLAALLLAAFARADGIVNRDCAKTTCPPSRYCCPDDYCAKPLPCVGKSACGRCDDYCPHPLPCVPKPGPYCGKDDYCPKCFPKCLPPSLRPWYVCSPPR